MNYFGKSWSSMTEEATQIPCPVNDKCLYCDEIFVEGEQGIVTDNQMPYHKNCFLRQITGSVGHIKKQCNCFGGTLEDPVGMTRRQAANAAVLEFELRQAGSKS